MSDINTIVHTQKQTYTTRRKEKWKKIKIKNNLTAHDGIYCCVWYTNVYESLWQWWCGLVHMCVCVYSLCWKKHLFFRHFDFNSTILRFLFSQSVGRSAGWSCLSSVYHIRQFLFLTTISLHFWWYDSSAQTYTYARRVCVCVRAFVSVRLHWACEWYVNMHDNILLLWKVLTASTYRYCGVVVVHRVRPLYIKFHTRPNEAHRHAKCVMVYCIDI